MKRVISFLSFLLIPVTLYAQSAAVPPHIDELLSRASDFRRLLATGDRVKASDFVIASKRKDFLNNPIASLQNIRLVGLQFVDKDHVYVQISGQALVSTGTGAQMAEPRVEDLWVRDKGNWYFQPETATIPSLRTMFKKDSAEDAAALAEIKSSFKFLSQSVDLGLMWQGDRKEVPIRFEYTGAPAIRIESKVDTPVTELNLTSSEWLSKDSKQFEIIAGSDDFEGRFDIPLTFTIYYKSVALEQSIRVKGEVRPVFKYRQEPAIIPPDSLDEFRIFLTNNTDEPADMNAINSDGKFYIIKRPEHLAPGEEGVITLKRNPAGKPPGNVIKLSFEKELAGRQSSPIPIR